MKQTPRRSPESTMANIQPNPILYKPIFHAAKRVWNIAKAPMETVASRVAAGRKTEYFSVSLGQKQNLVNHNNLKESGMSFWKKAGELALKTGSYALK